MFNTAAFLSFAFSMAATPGPNNLSSMSAASVSGLKKSYPFNFGVFTGVFIISLVTAFFCNAVSELLPKIKSVMLVFGAVYILRLAWKIYRSDAAVFDSKPVKSGFTDGMLLQLTNPKCCLYILVSMESYILPCYQGNALALVLFALLLASISLFCTLCWALFGSFFKLLFSQYAKTINTLLALALACCAAALFI
ncbi:MAG: LysE family transporter [Synergistaceae bacterium]|nr:LysE family transporter [Synergistaceae bacterium]